MDPHARPEDVAATFCATAVDEWVRAGITEAVVAPGSRSTPMALALADDGRVRVHVHHDERAAGFVALGLGRATGRPALVLTTSGTAAVELHAAIVEAHEDHVPLIALTADRPPELRSTGAPQTIDQQHLYGRAVRAFVDAGVPATQAAPTWRSVIARTVLAATGSPPGPVQLNLPFREPLIGRAAELPPGRKGGGPWHGVPGPIGGEPPTDAEALAAGFVGRTGVIVAGGGIADPDAVHALADRVSWPVIADPRSGCRLPRAGTISHADAVLRVPDKADELRPEVVLRLGTLPASKVLGQWLARTGAWQIGVAEHGRRSDPGGDLSVLLATEPSAFCVAISAVLDLDTTDRDLVPDDAGALWSRWVSADAEAAAAITAVLGRQSACTEPAVARDVVSSVPDGAHLLVSSSMPVRDVEWFSAPRTGIVVHANRGANGIDGVVATGLGIALGSRRPTAVLIGDVAFLYDLNVLVRAQQLGVDLTVVVVDNDGGGIFSFLPQADALAHDRFEQLFGTPHGADLVALATALGAEVRTIEHPHEVHAAVAGAMALGGVHVVIVRTDRTANVAVHAELNAAVAAALS